MIASTSTLKIQNGTTGEFETLVAAVTAKGRANEPGNVYLRSSLTPLTAAEAQARRG